MCALFVAVSRVRFVTCGSDRGSVALSTSAVVVTSVAVICGIDRDMHTRRDMHTHSCALSGRYGADWFTVAATSKDAVQAAWTTAMDVLLDDGGSIYGGW